MIVLDLRKKPEGLDQRGLQAALDEVREQPGSTVIIPPGIYTLTSPRARQTMQEAINGKYGENPEIEMFRPD